MNTDDSLKRFGIVPPDEALNEIRGILASEAAAERAGKPRHEDLALLSCVQLFSRGALEDVLRIWAAKRSGMDLGCYIDVQLLCGAGLTETKAFLSSQPGIDAAAALSYIERCEAAGDFVDFSPSAYLGQRKRYFCAD